MRYLGDGPAIVITVSVVSAEMVDWGELREHLSRRARALGAGSQIVEDLVQDALFEAWRARDRLSDAQGARFWGDAILRHVWLRFLRGREREQLLESRPDFETLAPSAVSLVPDDLADLEVELDREQLVELLDRALALLPIETRDLLVRRFVEEVPFGELAAHLGVSEAAVKMRVQRGKVALHRVFVTCCPEDASSLGLIDSSGSDWLETRLWCPLCAASRLHARVSGFQRDVDFRCPACTPKDRPSSLPAGLTSARDTKSLRLRTFGSIWNRLLATWWKNWPGGLADLTGDPLVTIVRAVEPMIVRPDGGPAVFHGVETINRRLNQISDVAAPMVALSSPKGQEFQRRHKRIRLSQYEEVEFGGLPAVRQRFESVSDSARLEVVLGRDDFRLYSAIFC